MTQDEIFALINDDQDEEIFLPPSDLESNYDGFSSEEDMEDLDNRMSSPCNIVDNYDSDDDSEFNMPLSVIKQTLIDQKKIEWSDIDSIGVPHAFSEEEVGIPSFINEMVDASPYDLFNLFITDEMLSNIVFQTNLYAEQIHLETGKKFVPTNIDEMKTFLGINIFMGIKRLPSYRDYWSSEPDLHDYFISNLMTVNRFSWLLGNLHLNNNAGMPKRNDPAYDKLYKLRPFLSSLEESFQKCFNLNEHVAIDESMIRFKGRSSLKQYMPKKPIKRGFKVWMLADETGYCWKFIIYTGKSIEGPQKSLGSSVVQSLCESLVGKGHKIFFDNYFNSVDLLSWLKKNKLNACGTINSNRKNLPTFKADKHFKKGDSESYNSNTGVSVWKWKDNRCIHLASNYHKLDETTIVNRKDKVGRITEVACPKLLKDYNSYMNCVDKFDQLKSLYEINRKSRKWWHRIFFYFIDASISNAFIINKLKNSDLKLKNFRRQIVLSLVAKQSISINKKRACEVLKESVNLGKRKPFTPKSIRHADSAHQPIRDSRRRCANCSTSKKEVRTDWICTICKIPLCLSKRRNCFQAYHYVSKY